MRRYSALVWVVAVALAVGGVWGPRWVGWLGSVIVFGSLAWFAVCQHRGRGD